MKPIRAFRLGLGPARPREHRPELRSCREPPPAPPDGPAQPDAAFWAVFGSFGPDFAPR